MNEILPSVNAEDKPAVNNRPKIWLIVVIALAVLMILRSIIALGAMGLLVFGSASSIVQADTDPEHYTYYMGDSAREEYRGKWGMDETIFPDSLKGLDVKEYKMVYYNPWDAQYLSYLTVQYDEEGFARESGRLAECSHDAYEGIYGASGFAGRDPLAMDADAYNGFVYAIPTPGMKNAVTYVMLVFCNYQYDMDYRSMIPEEYLPVGFDAGPGNAYGENARP